jgi:phosphohistidine phosphatase
MLIHKQSAVIPYRFKSGKLEILLISSLKKKNWIIPKGFVENGISAQKSAEKEALEEAGVKGIVQSNLLGIYHQKKWGGNCQIEVYAMSVNQELDLWPEKELRERKWFNIKDAIDLIYNKDLKQIVKEFQNSLS